jgi:hypothetical protein
MAPKGKTVPKNPGNSSLVWDGQFHGTGVQHTIYAPQLFFDLWLGDESELKKHVNEYLVSHANDEAPAPTPKAKAAVKKPAAKAVFEVSDDDI